MSALWPLSRTLEFDRNGNPMVGAQAFFFNSGGEIPQTTYQEAGLSTVSDHDGDGAVTTDANGRWPAVFLNTTPGTYRVRVLDPDGVVLFDDDAIPVPAPTDTNPPDAGDTSEELLFQTGDLKHRYGDGAHAGWVRLNGKTIGSAVSGATERANDDAEPLFLYLYDADTTLAVSGGRGSNAASDWAADKAIALPDGRGRGLIALADMGNTASTILDDIDVDGSGDVTTLGSTLGEGTHVLTLAELAAHTHGGATGAGGAFNPKNGSYDRLLKHDGNGTIGTADSTDNSGSEPNLFSSAVIGTAADHTHSIPSAGSDAAHPNVQPSMLVTIYLKL